MSKAGKIAVYFQEISPLRIINNPFRAIKDVIDLNNLPVLPKYLSSFKNNRKTMQIPVTRNKAAI